MCWSALPLSLVACSVLVCTLAPAADPSPVAGDERVLKNAGLGPDDAALLALLRKRTPTAEEQANLMRLTRELGDGSYKVGDQASIQLVASGLLAVPFLRQALASPDPEIVHRGKACLRLIDEQGKAVGVATAAARLLAARKPAGAVEALLAFLPFAESDSVAEAVQTALAQVAARSGRPDPALVLALSDPLPARRAAAADVLCRSCAGEPRAELRKLLGDADPSVRLRAALGLACANDKDAVPVLIDLLVTLPPARAWQAEDALLRLAGEQAPPVPLGGEDAARRQCRDSIPTTALDRNSIKG
jgi:hypothetical protein